LTRWIAIQPNGVAARSGARRSRFNAWPPHDVNVIIEAPVGGDGMISIKRVCMTGAALSLRVLPFGHNI
jgi:hypothetical protein